MTPEQFLRSLDEVGLLQCLIWGEARGEPLEGQVAVGCVVKNRVQAKPWRKQDWQGVMLKRKQFSCFNSDDPNLMSIVAGYFDDRWKDPIWKTCKWIAHGVIYDFVPDTTDGANHYCAISLTPYWAKGQEPVKVIGNHKFYRL